MSKKVILLTGYDHFFGQTRKPWVSINTELLSDIFRNNGIEITELTFDQIVNKGYDIRDSVIVYSFSQRPHIRAYIRDIIFTLSGKGNVVIPSYEMLLCHENKGFAELVKQKYGLGEPWAFYFSNLHETTGYNLSFPLVFKTLDGSNAK